MRKSLGTAPVRGSKAQSGFFEKQLAGEQGPSFETAKRLCELAAEFFARKPWEFLEDQDLILLEDPQAREICYCSIMGALGEVYSLHVYLGVESYRFFRRLAAGKPITPGEFLAAQRSVSLEFVMPSELTPPDRELLRAVGHPVQRGVRVPIFRAFRPGFHPWYVTLSEAILLIRCLQATNTFCRTLAQAATVAYWDELDAYPFLVPTGSDENSRDYEVRMVKAPEPPPASPQMPLLDAAQMRQIRQQDFAVGGGLEVDHFFTSAPVGEKNERKACVRVGLVTDAATGFLFPPALGKPEDSIGDTLVTAVLSAIKTAQRMPAEVRVKQQDFKVLLEPTAAALGFSIRVMKSLPSLQLARDHLLAMMGDPGTFAG